MEKSQLRLEALRMAKQLHPDQPVETNNFGSLSRKVITVSTETLLKTADTIYKWLCDEKSN